MLEGLAVVVAVLVLMGVGAGAVYWGMSYALDASNKHIDGLNAAIKELEADNHALEDSYEEILRTWQAHATAAGLPPAERIGVLLSFDRIRREARNVSRASAVGGRQGRVDPPVEGASQRPDSSGHDPLPGLDHDPGEPEPLDHAGGSLPKVSEQEDA